MSGKRSLKELLADHKFDTSDSNAEDMVVDSTGGLGECASAQDPRLCVDCGDQPKELDCVECGDGFCQVCFKYIHRTGRRKSHQVVPLQISGSSSISRESSVSQSEQEKDAPEAIDSDAAEILEADIHVHRSQSQQAKDATMDQFCKNAQFIPMRLSMEERKLFRLLEAALHVSEYTDNVDILSYSSKAKRIVRQLREMCTVLTGLVVAHGLEVGKDLVDGQDFAAHAEWYQTIFEIGRRYKIQNPERMRSGYGKLAYMIMDSRLPEVRDILEFDLYKPVVTVHQVLEEHGAQEMLKDPMILIGTREIVAGSKPRHKIQAEIRAKEQAIATLSSRYAKGSSIPGTRDKLQQVLYSIGDYYAYLGANRTPVEDMIKRLNTQFTREDEDASLAISVGRAGARLSHSHQKQYQYVLQSLTLWSEIMRDMYMLWKYADDDLLSINYRYSLQDTGQGLNRIKVSPKVGRAMHNIISRAQKATGTWVGSAVVHLGDRAVPNALFFLDKYLQVPRILNPVHKVLDLFPEVLKDKSSQQWVMSQFGSIENLEHVILVDFFRHAFDGSGADNFYDAGSCIDGRLTSAWNWANELPRKPFYKHFLVAGFVGFDGQEGF